MVAIILAELGNERTEEVLQEMAKIIAAKVERALEEAPYLETVFPVVVEGVRVLVNKGPAGS